MTRPHEHHPPRASHDPWPCYARGFTIVEMLVVVSIIGVLMALLLPAVGRARTSARIAVSATNLHQIGIAHASYAADWDGRQMTFVVDNIANYGNDPETAALMYKLNGPTGEYPQGVILGWSPRPGGGSALDAFYIGPDNPTNYEWMQPIIFDQASTRVGLGWFRIPNARPLNQYLGGRFYDPVFYAPQDVIVMDRFRVVEDMPGEYIHTENSNPGEVNWENPCWSSYCTSPAALLNPTVMSADGWQDPWSLPAGFRAPSFSQAAYSDLKTHVMEHQWLQGRRKECNAAAPRVNYGICEPFYFNHSRDSSPQALFYDGHVGQVGVRQAELADGRIGNETGAGLWSRTTPFGPDGYFGDIGYDDAKTSFHILTVDGIRGRDVLGGS